jgi:hypothetical protein
LEEKNELELIVDKAYNIELENIFRNYFKECFVNDPENVVLRTKEGIAKLNVAYEVISKNVR